jgi:hypothetical protein
MSTVERIEQATRQFAVSDAQIGGGLICEAAAGHLRYAVDLARHATYSEAVGQRLLAAVAHLAGWLGWMCFDANLPGAQRYSVYALRAAREVGGEAARLRVSRRLVDLAYQARASGDPKTGVRFIELALDQVPADRRRFTAVRAELWDLRAYVLAPMGAGYLPEVRHDINRAFDLAAEADHDEPDPATAADWSYAGEAELASLAAEGCLDLAGADRGMAEESERLALRAVNTRGAGFVRSRVFDQITLARARLRRGEPEQACLDAATAVDMAGSVVGSRRVPARLRALRADTRPHQHRSDVRELRERLRLATAS